MIIGCILTNVCSNPAAGDVINLGGGLLFAKFSRDDESEADRVGLHTVVRAGIDPRGVPEMFRILLEERRQGSSAVGGWFSTHPLEEDRMRAAESEIARFAPSVLDNLTSDTERYQEFTRRLKSLPISRTPGR